MFRYTIIDNESELLANGYENKNKSRYYNFYAKRYFEILKYNSIVLNQLSSNLLHLFYKKY